MNLNKQRSKPQRTRVFAAVSVIAVILLLVLNLLITYFGLHKSLYIDTTSEGLYSLSDAMKRECDFIDELDDDDRCVKITFCADPDTLIASEQMRVTYFMALKLAARYENLEVETVNVVYNPTAVAKYKPTSLKTINPSDIIISYGDRYRIAGANKFWVTSQNELWSYNGEYKMVSLIKSVTAVNRPVAYFITDHGESYYDESQPESEMSLDNAALYDLLGERGMQVKTLRISEVDKIPDDCVLLIINNPKSDFIVDGDRLDELNTYISDTEKLDRYLVKNQGALMVARDYDAARRDPLPVLDAFLREWGFDFSEAQVYDDENYIAREDGSYADVQGEYDRDDNSYGFAIYGDIASVTSAPPMVFSDTGYITCSYSGAESVPEDGTSSISRNFASLFDSYETAYASRVGDDGMSELVKKGKLTLAATTSRIHLDSETAENSYSYVFCANSPNFFSSDVLGNSSYSNYDAVSALVENIARTDEYASMELGGVSGNSPKLGGKQLLNTDLSATPTDEKLALSQSTATGITVAIMLIPVAVMITGIVISVRRKFL